ncbi:MAG: TlpA disulfide reductase family protein [Tetrasphaera sp.]
MRLTRRAAVAAVALTALAACSTDPNSVAEQAKDGSQKNYISGDGSIQQAAPDKRGDPVELTGTTLDGTAWSIGTTRGKPLVINLWASWCPPCQKEAPAIKEVSEKTAFADTVAFLGINQRESAETAAAQVRAWGHTFPTLSDDGGTALLALQGKAAAMPSTLVLDRDGRIAAWVGGPVTAATLTGLIEDVLAEAPS